MEINIGNNSIYKDAKIVADSTTIELGLMDSKEAKELAQTFLSAAYDLIASDQHEALDAITVAENILSGDEHE